MLGIFAGEVVRASGGTASGRKALDYVALCWIFLLWLYRKKVFLKI